MNTYNFCSIVILSYFFHRISYILKQYCILCLALNLTEYLLSIFSNVQLLYSNDTSLMLRLLGADSVDVTLQTGAVCSEP